LVAPPPSSQSRIALESRSEQHSSLPRPR
jgi:hypothetical protein